MNKEYNPISYSEALHYATIAKKLSRNDAETIQRVLMWRAQEAGCSSDDVFGIITSITDRFVEEDKEMRRQLMLDDLRRQGIMTQKQIEADEEQIIKAIKQTLPKFKSDLDWGGIYRILVDFCDYPATKTEFVRKFARMGIYPNDNVVRDIKKLLPSSIYKNEYCGHPFSYQAIQKGIDNSWPTTYQGWKLYNCVNRDFQSRKEIASLFLKHLITITKER